MPTRTWFGGNGNWQDSSRWLEGFVPTGGDDVRILAGNVSNSINATANFFIIENGASLTTTGDMYFGSTCYIGGGASANASLFAIAGGTSDFLELIIGNNLTIGSSVSGRVNVSTGVLETVFLTVGLNGDGVLTVSNGGLVVSNQPIEVGNGSTNGFVYIGGETAAAAAGSIIGNVDLNTAGSIFTFRTTDTATYTGIISGIGSVRQLSFGQIAKLLNDNTYSGGTTIGNNAFLQVGDGGSSGSLGSGAVSINGVGELYFNRIGGNYTVGNTISGSGLVTVGGSATAMFTGTNSYSITRILSGATMQIGDGGTTGSLGTGVVNNSGTLKFNLANVGSYTIANLITSTGNVEFSGTFFDAFVTANNNYGGTTLVTNNAYLFVGNGGTTGSLGAGAVTVSANSLLGFFRSGSAYSVNHVISGDGVVEISGSAPAIFTQANNYQGGTTINAGATLVLGNGAGIGVGGTLGNGAVVFNGAGTLIFNRSGFDYTIANAISGGGNVVAQGGTQTNLTGTNSYTGTTTINNGSSLQIGDGGTSGSLGSGAVVIDGGGILKINRSGPAFTIANAISGDGNVVAQGDARTILTGNNSYTGTTTINSVSSLQIGNGGTSGALGTGAIINNGTLRFFRSDNETINNAISGSGVVTISGGGTTTLSGNNSYSGTTEIGGDAALQIGNGGTAGSLGTGTVFNSGALTFNRSGADYTVSNAITGIGSMTVTGGARATFTGALAIGNSVVISGGATLALSGTTALANAIEVNIRTGSTFDISGISTATTSIRNIDVDAGGQVVLGGRTLIVTNAFSFDNLGSFVGSAGTDAVIFNVATSNFDVRGTYTNWTEYFDTITVNGNDNDNILTADDLQRTIINGGGGGDTINGGQGDDLFNGEFGNDTLYGNLGADRLDGGEGADQLYGGEGIDTISIDFDDTVIDGGNGTDYVAINGNGTLTTALTSIENLFLVATTNITMSGSLFSTGLSSTLAIDGTGTITVNMDVSGNFISKLMTFIGNGVSLTVNGTTGTDIFKLGNAAHSINAGNGTDQIKGGDRVDTINGGGDVDKINGAGGADILTGGAGNDVFKYARISDSGIGAAADRISDFAIGGDRLNFGRIDTSAFLPGDQAFAFIGSTGFSGTGPAQIRYQTFGADLLVQADVDGDGNADMEIILQGLAGGTLTAADFVL